MYKNQKYLRAIKKSFFFLIEMKKQIENLLLKRLISAMKRKTFMNF